MNLSKIDWCDYTWNPVTGCFHGCEYCYARGISRRFCTNEHGHEGLLAPCDGDCRACVEMDGLEFVGADCLIAHSSPFPYGFFPTLYPDRLTQPATMDEPQNIFVCSMGDLFGDWVPDRWIQKVFAACVAAPRHTYMFLTKYPERYNELFKAGILPTADNYWYGSTITGNGETTLGSDGKINAFLSIEPLLNNVMLDESRGGFTAFQWVIIGAETGNRKNKVIPEREWIKEIASQCREWRIPVFMKSSLAKVWGEPLIQEYPW